jgi:hypothetical protein
MKFKRIIVRHMTMMELLIGMALASLLMVVLTQFYSQVSTMNVASEKAQKESFKKRYVEYRLSAVLPAALEKVNKKVTFFTSNDLSGLLAENSSSLVFIYQAGPSQDPARSGNLLARLYLDKQGRVGLATWPVPKNLDKESALPPAHNEILMEGIEKLQFKFYVPPKRERKKWRNGIFEVQAPVENNNEPKEGILPGAAPDPTKPPENKENPKPPQGDANKPQQPEAQDPAKKENKDNKEEEVLGPEEKDRWYDEWKKDYKELPAMVKIIVTPIGAKSDDENIIFAFPLPNSHEAIVYE